jgi:uncharacterized protein (TIGR00725 family)
MTRSKPKTLTIAVIGGHNCSKQVEELAHNLGKNIAKVGYNLVCGGLGGVMEAVSRGCKEEGGLTIGILPGEDKKSANPFIDIVIPTGLGYTRNTLVVQTGDVVLALPGEYGTLSEIAFALVLKKPVIGIGSWDIPGVIQVKTVTQAMEKLAEILR